MVVPRLTSVYETHRYESQRRLVVGTTHSRFTLLLASGLFQQGLLRGKLKFSAERAKIFLQNFFLPWKSDWGRRSSRGLFQRRCILPFKKNRVTLELYAFSETNTRINEVITPPPARAPPGSSAQYHSIHRVLVRRRFLCAFVFVFCTSPHKKRIV